MYVTGGFKRRPGFTNIKMCLAGLATMAHQQKCHVKWPPIPWGRDPKDGTLTIHDLFDLEATEEALGYRLPKPSNHRRLLTSTDDLWSWLRGRSQEPLYKDFMAKAVLAKPLRLLVHGMLGSLDNGYGVIHLRTEDDWKAYAQRRAKVTYWDEDRILKLVANQTDLPKQLVLVGAKVEALCATWSKTLQRKVTCRNRILPATAALDYTRRSALDFELARHASWFVGHRYSSFSLEAAKTSKTFVQFYA